MFVRTLVILSASLLYFTIETMSFSESFLGNHTLNLTDIVLLEKTSKQPQSRVTFHEKTDGKSGASESRKQFASKRQYPISTVHEEEKIVQTVLNRFPRSDRIISPLYNRGGIPIPDHNTLTMYDPVKARKPTTQTIEYYGFVPFSLRTKSDPKSIPRTLMETGTATSGPFSMPNSIEWNSYQHSTLFRGPTTTVKRKKYPKTSPLPLVTFDNITNSEAAKLLVTLSGEY